MNPPPEIHAGQIVGFCSGQVPEKPTARECERVLGALLLDGSRDSREVLATMANRGLSPKQVRRAREKLGVVVERHGNGAAMRSTWCLPEPAIHAHDDEAPVARIVTTKASTKAPHFERGTHGVQDGTKQTPALAKAPAAVHHDSNGMWSEGECRRHTGRVDAFARRGIKLDVARQVADLLVVADRENRHAYGSCAQCVSLNTSECSVPRPVVEVHVCWLRRCAIN